MISFRLGVDVASLADLSDSDGSTSGGSSSEHESDDDNTDCTPHDTAAAGATRVAQEHKYLVVDNKHVYDEGSTESIVVHISFNIVRFVFVSTTFC